MNNKKPVTNEEAKSIVKSRTPQENLKTMYLHYRRGFQRTAENVLEREEVLELLSTTGMKGFAIFLQGGLFDDKPATNMIVVAPIESLDTRYVVRISTTGNFRVTVNKYLFNHEISIEDTATPIDEDGATHVPIYVGEVNIESREGLNDPESLETIAKHAKPVFVSILVDIMSNNVFGTDVSDEVIQHM